MFRGIPSASIVIRFWFHFAKDSPGLCYMENRARIDAHKAGRRSHRPLPDLPQEQFDRAGAMLTAAFFQGNNIPGFTDAPLAADSLQ
jgi:hypothetical protein